MQGYYGFMLVFPCPSVCPSVVCQFVLFSFPDNLSKDQWIFTKLGVIIDIVEIWFWTANGQIASFLTELSASNTSIFSFQDINLSKSQWIFTRLYMCIDIVEIWFGIAYGQISSIFVRVMCLWRSIVASHFVWHPVCFPALLKRGLLLKERICLSICTSINICIVRPFIHPQTWHTFPL